MKEIFVLHEAQRPFKKIQLKSGIFWNQRISDLHLGHREPGWIMDIPLGILQIQTLKKDPNTNP